MWFKIADHIPTISWVDAADKFKTTYVAKIGSNLHHCCFECDALNSLAHLLIQAPLVILSYINYYHVLGVSFLRGYMSYLTIAVFMS